MPKLNKKEANIYAKATRLHIEAGRLHMGFAWLRSAPTESARAKRLAVLVSDFPAIDWNGAPVLR